MVGITYITNLHKVVQWARKWEREGVLEESVCNWIVVENPKPAKLYANVKTHKENWPVQIYHVLQGYSHRKSS